MEAYLNNRMLEKYLDEKLPYCREERQFAVFLYNIFLEEMKNKNNNNEIVKKCLDIRDNECKQLVIEDVFFEATLMRDFFEKKREKFNEELLSFCLEWLIADAQLKDKEDPLIKLYATFKKDSPSRNLGQISIKDNILKDFRGFTEELGNAIKNAIKNGKGEICPETLLKAKEKACLDIARMMMNATPDILVIYTKDGKTYAKALECKYLSQEGTYEDVAGVKSKMQLFIQECVMHFLFGKREDSDKPYFPVRPQKGNIWGDGDCDDKDRDDEDIDDEDIDDGECNKELKDKLWKNIFMYVYEHILQQERESQNVINAGVKLIRFKSQENERMHKGEEIEISELMNIYKNNESR